MKQTDQEIKKASKKSQQNSSWKLWDLNSKRILWTFSQQCVWKLQGNGHFLRKIYTTKTD